MRTIAFYSYRGGSGKSLLAANLAVCLSRLNRSCVLVDLDVDAPSLHSKIGAGEPALGVGGLVGLLADSVALQEGKTWNSARLEDIDFVLSPDVRRYSYLLDDVRDREAAIAHPEFGRIRIFPAGDVYRNHYWEIVWSGLWRDIFTVVGRRDHGAATVDDVERVMSFLRKIKRRIECLAEHPEYLIVDCRSGASDLTTTVLNAWLERSDIDKLVYPFAFNEESVNYLDSMVRRLVPDMRDRLIMVLSRVPTSVEYRGDRRLMNALRKLGADPREISILHSDRDLENEERIRLGLHTPPDNRMLTVEYLKLFEKLIAPEHWLGKVSLSLDVGLGSESIEERERLFILDPRAGALINPNDMQRNVALSIGAFHQFLRGFEMVAADPKGMLSGTRAFDDPESAGANVVKALFDSGVAWGSRFGESLAAALGEHRRLGPLDRIETWCDLDSKAGLGKFKVDPETPEIRGTRLLHCDLVLHESWLTPANDTDFKSGGHRYCDLMRGYIHSVLARLLNIADDGLVVEHEPNPHSSQERSESCRFAVWDREFKAQIEQREDPRHAAQFYSCFISYSHSDKAFAKKLHEALQRLGIGCWLDEKQLLPGDDIYDQVDQGVRLWDKLLLCCSEHSLLSWWVDSEIGAAFEKEQQLTKERGQKIQVLIPLNIDGYLFSDQWSSGYRSQIRRRLAADFMGWEQDPRKFDSQVETVLRALRIGSGGRPVPPQSRL